MNWIYLSPHFDDAAFSCGGLIWKQARAGQKTAVWTICGGDPPPGPLSSFAQSLHDRWGLEDDPVAHRRVEDGVSCRKMGADRRQFSIPDCIYRRSPQDGAPLYASEQALFGPVHPEEEGLIEALGKHLALRLPVEANIVCPLTIGGHADHRLTRAAAERCERTLWYYADFPYVQMEKANLAANADGLQVEQFHLDEAALEVWMEAAAAHASQISSFWVDIEAMKEAMRDYYREVGGLRLWCKI